MVPQTALKYEVEVTEDGHIEIDVPLPAGRRVTVVVIEQATDGTSADNFDDLIAAAESSLDFWDNPYDDENWNNA